MTIHYVNTGTSANSGNGDSLRVAFTKINANFDQLSYSIGLLPAIDVGAASTVYTDEDRAISGGTA